MVVDNHADEINKSTNKIWNLFYQDTLLYLCVKKVQKYVIKFYGVTPGRCDFLDRPYGAPKNKITLLPIGGDTNQTDNIQLSKSQLRSKYNIPLDSIVIVTGGKMGIGKGTDSLLSACKTLSKKYQNIRLLMFGRFLDEKTQKQSEEETVAICHGWCDRNTTLELLKLSDVACWPIHHTTLIEDAVASALPLIVRKTPNTTHLVNGNGEYVEDGTSEELVLALEKIVNNYEQYKEQALIMHDKFSYKNIVKQIEKDYEDGK
jgi:glycosyltransferase involved in cell wall biosynthesis